MRLAICDDDLNDLAKLKGLLQTYKGHCPGIHIEINIFSDATELLQEIQKGMQTDLYILDILMSNITGIDLGTEIRKNNPKSMIIYVTSSDSFAMEAYDLHAIRYLLKPTVERDLFEALDYAISHMDRKKSSVFLVKTKEGLTAVPYSEIEYIENASRKLDIHLTNGEIVTSIFMRKSFDEEIEELVQVQNFICVHKSFLINMNYIRKLNQSDMILDSGTRIPVSRRRTLQVKKEYLLFVSNQYK